MPWAVRQVGFPPPRCSGEPGGKAGRGTGAAGSRGRGRAEPLGPAGLPPPERGGLERRGAGERCPTGARVEKRAFGSSRSFPPRTHTRSLCRLGKPGPFAEGALPCHLLRAFTRGVVKAQLKTRASSSAALRLTSARAAGLGAGAGEPLPSPHGAPQRRPGGQGAGGRPQGAGGAAGGCPGAAGQLGRCRSGGGCARPSAEGFPGCFRCGFLSAWPLLLRRQTSP